MSFTRAFSKRIAHRDTTPPSTPSRHLSIKRQSSNSVSKSLISSPVELLSTTNMISYTAPNLRTSLSAATAPRYSSEEPSSPGSPPPLTPDLGSTPPSTPPPHEDNPLCKNSYFLPRDAFVQLPAKSLKRSNSVGSAAGVVTVVDTMVPPPKSPSRSRSTHNKPSKSNPFGAELEKVSELAEEMGLDLEDEYMKRHGLVKCSPDEYLAEVEAVIVLTGVFGMEKAGWI